MTQKFYGIIKSLKEYKNNVVNFCIQNENKTQEFTYFMKDDPNKRIDISRYVTVEYNIQNNKNPKYGKKQNIIKNIKYGDYVTDKRAIMDFLVDELQFSDEIADKIYETHGENTIDVVLNDTDKLKKEIKNKYWEQDIAAIEKYKKENEVNDYSIVLEKLGIAKKYHTKIISLLGKDISTIKQNMYILYLKCGMSFKDCDALALKNGYDKNNDDRIDCFIIMLYKKCNGIGRLYLLEEEINDACKEYTITKENVVNKLIKINDDETDYYTTEKIYVKEQQIEEICNKLVKKKPIYVFFNEKLFKDQKPTDEQILAIKKSLENSISIISGGPGTGKSFLIKKIVEKAQLNSCVYILAPTGAAVERLRCEKYKGQNIKIRTIQSFVYIHKNLYKKNNGYDDDKTSMIENVYDMYEHYDEFIFFIDEMSMVDMNLFYKFLIIISKIIEKVRLVILGDKNQLPSIQGGNILNDLITSKKIKTTFLKKCHRTDNKNIIVNADLVLNGGDIKPDGKCVKYIEANSFKEIKNILITLIKENNIKYENSCILIPTKQKGICTNKFNLILQNIYNPLKKVIGNNQNYMFRIGDKIMQGKNNKEKDIYNGSIMVVSDVTYNTHNKTEKEETDKKINPNEMTCKYSMDDLSKINDSIKLDDTLNLGLDIDESKTIIDECREIIYKKYNKQEKTNTQINDFIENNIDLAYAMTVHKAQGKGYDTVIIIIHSSMFRGLLNRNMFYTAITRAKKECIIIGDIMGLETCKSEMPSRITNLYRAKDILDDNVIFINQNIGRCLNNKIICKRLEMNDINLVNLKNRSKHYNREKIKLINILEEESELKNMLLREICKNKLNKSKIVEV